MADEVFYSPEEAQKRLNSLPQEIQDVLYSAKMLSTMRTIGEKNKLHIDQIGLLQSETSAVMMGFVATQDFVQNLMRALNIDQQLANTLATDVDQMLFSKIRDAMKKVYEEGRAGTAPASSSPAAAKPAAAPPTQATVAAPQPAMPPIKAPDLHPAEVMMSQKTVQVAPTPTTTPTNPSKSEPPKPQPYKADPYREPIE